MSRSVIYCMDFSIKGSALLAFFCALGLFGCSAGGGGASIIGTGGGSSNPGGGTAGVSVGPGAGGLDIPIDIQKCGNGTLDQGEQCDDGNVVNADGCNAVCQIEADYECPTPGQLCVYLSVCGDAKLASNEICDDGNTSDGDGCSANCSQIEPGWQCRVPGRRCIPWCGDGVITATENCDDGNTVNGDGCSSTCLTEPGYTCQGTPSVCVASVCGNGVREAGEGCDLGADNGLFYGDGQGCSTTCTQEPNCRPNGVTQACTTACGDGNHDVDEECDDGNAVSGDGCSDTCHFEGGFECTDQPMADAVPCPSNPAAQCLVLPVIYRDFEGQQVSGGHPDFFYYSAPAANGRTTGVVSGATTTTCVPNASGVKGAWTAGSACLDTDASGPCLGIAADTLGPTGKPELAKSTCDCVFTDWDLTGVLGSCTTDACTPTVPGAQECWVENEGSHRLRIDAPVTVVQSADTFAQWYTDVPGVNTTVRGTLELAAVGGEQYQFSSSNGRTVYDDLHDIFLGTATTLTSGFFPLDTAAGSKLCNIWPYWIPGLATNCGAGAGFPVASQWDPKGSYTAGVAGTGGPVAPVVGMMRNFYFTTEARYLFRYDGQARTLAFYGDDDVWVFINGHLALDLGAPHERIQGSVLVNDTFGLEVGKIYEIAVFHADRHPRESNYQLTISGFATNRSTCVPACGDGVATTGEECDDGAANAVDAYGGCTPDCTFGPYCGDGITNGPEQCDAGGPALSSPYGQGLCTAACTFAHYCGDGIVDSAYGEECDGGGSCDAECKIFIR